MRWRLDPARPRSVGLGPVSSPPFWREQRRCRGRRGSSRWRQPGPSGRAGHDGAVPTHTRFLPVAQPSPASHARAATPLLRQHLPGDAALQHKDDAAQRRPVRDRRPTALRLRPLRRQQRFDQGPQFIAYKGLGHAAQNSPHLPPFPALLGALSHSNWMYRRTPCNSQSPNSVITASTKLT